jgi:GNAT superfamily N-acetyltransferase
MLKISEYIPGDEVKISQLVKEVYDEFVAPDYNDEGNKFFCDFIEPENFRIRFQEKHNIILLAEYSDQLAGVIEMRDNSYVSLLFVNKTFQGKGIAKALFKEAVCRCVARDHTLKKIFVHASPFSIGIYEKLGFTKTDEMQEENGIKYLPMEIMLTSE